MPLQPASEAVSPDETVDARGHRCPMPLLMAKRALNGLASGDQVLVLATDESSIRDFETFSRQSGHKLLAADAEGGEFRLLLEKR